MRALAIVVAAWSAVAAAEPAYTAKVEVVDKHGERHAIVASKLTCATPAKCPEWSLDLGRVDSAELVAVIDLLGAPTTVPRRATGADIIASLPESAKLPAAFVHVDDTDGAGTRWDRLVIVSLEGGRASLIWRGELAMTPRQGGGFDTVDAVALVATAAGKPLALEVVQRARPRGPPLRRRFVLNNGRYERE